ncbi:MAG: hypothetical protein ACRD8W_19965 [Nitrososphaeraceae archaeon]
MINRRIALLIPIFLLIIAISSSHISSSGVQHAHAYGGKVSKSLNGIYNYTSNNLNRGNSFQIFPNTISTNTSAEISNQTNIFGIHKLYPTAGNGEEWYMNMSDPSNDLQFDPQVELVNNTIDTSWHVDDSKVRMNVYTSSGYDESKITTYDQKELAKNGYMQSPNDWRNVEMTGFVKYEEGDDDQNFAWYVRGGKHTDSEDCEASAYKGQLFYEGDSRFAKQQWFVSYTFTDEKEKMTYHLEDRWIGFKFVVYNLPPLKNGTIYVKLENWINENGDGISWKKIDEKIDRGHWGERGDHCDGDPAQIITWGGPIATFRWDKADGVDIRYFSIREIEPPEPGNELSFS